MAASDYLEDALLKHLFEGAAYTQPTLWVGLSVGEPLDDESGLSEPGNGYARIRPADDTGRWQVGVDGGTTTAENKGAIEFPEASGSWGTITHVALFDDETAGNMLAYVPLDTSVTIGTGDTFLIAAGNLSIELD